MIAVCSRLALRLDCIALITQYREQSPLDTCAMSEYQYYEFAAIDRPLTRIEMAELRAVSTRVIISPGGFTNHYEWGDLKADPADWMRRYFDAFVYSANWCSCHLSLRLPKAVFRKAELNAFIRSAVLSIDTTDAPWIFSWTLAESEDDDHFSEDDGSGWMRRCSDFSGPTQYQPAIE